MLRSRQGAALLALTALSLGACSMVPGGGTRDQAAGGRAEPARSAPTYSASQCLARLGDEAIGFTALPDQYFGGGCSAVGTVQLRDVPSDYSRLFVSNLGPVTCEVSEAFAGWARFGVDRAARQMLGSPLRSIETFGSYACRDVAGTGRRSAHASAAAIDVSGFVLEDGRRVTVRDDWSGGDSAEREFLRLAHGSACRRFGMVLGPQYNDAHRDHFHLEGVAGERGSFCR